MKTKKSQSLKIAIVSDSYASHISGVAVILRELKKELELMGHQVLVISPQDFRFKVPLPRYPEIKLTLFAYRKLARMLDDFSPDSLHIAVEGPLGLAARRYAKKHKLKFSTAYHTRFPEYISYYARIPANWIYSLSRWFHNSGDKTLVTTLALKSELEKKGFKNLVLWECGVDSKLFNPKNPAKLSGKRPIFMYMGRIAIEKNLKAFLSLDLLGTKYVVGDGPAKNGLASKYPDAIFTGYKFGDDLASTLAAADVFVFPSLTDTLGMVMLEANACGVPVAALPSQASMSVIKNGVNGIISGDLKKACLQALKIPKTKARKVALNYSWQQASRRFLKEINL